MDRGDYMREYNANRKESQRDYYRGYNAKASNRRRRHNRYVRDKRRLELEKALKALINDIDVTYEIVQGHSENKPKNNSNERS